MELLNLFLVAVLLLLLRQVTPLLPRVTVCVT